MVTHRIVRVCAIAAAIGICSIATFAEPMSISKVTAVSSALRSQPDSASLSDRAIFLSSANKKAPTNLSFSAGANMMSAPAVSLAKIGTPLNAVTVPEPSTMLLFGSGLLTALGYRARRRFGKSA